MPPSKQRSQSPAASRGAASSPAAAARGGRSPSPSLIKARHSRYKEVSGDAVWLPDLESACELAAVTFLLLPGLMKFESPAVQAGLQRLCVFLTGGCILGRFLFAVKLPKCSVSVTPDKNDRLIVASQLETALELAMPEVSGDKANSAYYAAGPPGKGVKGLWHQPDRDQAPHFVPCAELMSEEGDYTVDADEAPKAATDLFATNPAVQKSNLEGKLKKDWSAAATQVEQIVFLMYGLLGFCVLRPSQGFNFESVLCILLALAATVGLHKLGLGINDHAITLNIPQIGIGPVDFPAALWKLDLNARKSGNAAVITLLKGMGGTLRTAALAVAGVATVVRPLFILQELRQLAEWYPILHSK